METIQITENDVGKDVVDGDGNQVGIVSAVKHGTAYVDPDPGMLTKVKAKLGWEDVDDEAGYPLHEEAVATVTDDEIRLTDDR